MTAVSLTGYGRYLPAGTISGEEIAERSGIPESVVVEKMGLVEKRVCPPDDDHCTDMCVAAGEAALADAGIDASAVDLVLYHGSEYKDHIVWSAAADIAERLGAENAYATESYTLCAGCPIAIRQARAQLLAESLDTVLLVTASREEDLIDYENEDSSFMFNFGSGGAAYVLEADPEEKRVRARVRESHAVTDGSFADDVVMPAGGSVRPPSEETVAADQHTLDVPDPDGMKERLAPVSLPNYLTVADAANRPGPGRRRGAVSRCRDRLHLVGDGARVGRVALVFLRPARPLPWHRWTRLPVTRLERSESGFVRPFRRRVERRRRSRRRPRPGGFQSGS